MTVAASSAAPIIAGPAYEFDASFQEKITALMLRDATFASRADGLVQPGYLISASETAIAEVAQNYFAKYRTVPSLHMLPTLMKDAVANKMFRPDLMPDIKEKLGRILRADLSDREFVLDKVAEFAKHQALEAAILASVHLHEKRDYAKIEALMRQALDVGQVDQDLEYDYWAQNEARTQLRLDIAAGKVGKRGISSGYPDIDKHLYQGGWGRKELSVFMGAAKSGKSIGIHDLAKNACLLPRDPKDPLSKGHNILDITLEISKEILADRIDANMTDTVMNALGATPFNVRDKVNLLEANAGLFKIYEFASGTLKPSALRRILERYRSQGILFDMMVVDYMDLMCPEVVTDSPTENSKSIAIALRALAFEFDMAVLTATQTNREGAKKNTAGANDVAEDINKVRIADIVISINATDDEKRNSEARLYWAAVRNGEDGFTVVIRQDRARMKFITKVIGRV